MTLAIETHNLSKHYGDVTAVNDLSLKVEEGEIYAFLGLNGAGKTTTIRMLLGMIKPTQGSARVLDTPVHQSKREPWASVGYLVETPNAYGELTVRENLDVARRLHPGVQRAAIEQVIEQLDLTKYAERRAGTLSLGNKQRLGLAKALLHDPQLLILDEPANGLDPAGIVEIRELLLSLSRERGVTVFISSHILGEVSRLASRIGFIHQGRLIQEVDTAELEINRQRRLLVQARDIESARQTLVGAGRSADMLAGGVIALHDPASIERPDDVASLLVAGGTPPLQITIEEEDLEHYFLRLIGLNGDNNHAYAA